MFKLLNLKDYIYIIVILFIAGWFTRNQIHNKNIIQDKQAVIGELRSQNQRLVMAKTETVVKSLTIVRPAPPKMTPTVLESKVIFHGDSCPELREVSVVDTLNTVDFSLPYRLRVLTYGDISFEDFGVITFGDYYVHKQETIKNHIVYRDKLIEENRSHLYAYFMFGYAWTLDDSYSFEGGLNYVIKDKFGLMAGYQRYGKIDFLKAGFSIKLK